MIEPSHAERELRDLLGSIISCVSGLDQLTDPSTAEKRYFEIELQSLKSRLTLVVYATEAKTETDFLELRNEIHERISHLEIKIKDLPARRKLGRPRKGAIKFGLGAQPVKSVMIPDQPQRLCGMDKAKEVARQLFGTGLRKIDGRLVGPAFSDADFGSKSEISWATRGKLD